MERFLVNIFTRHSLRFSIGTRTGFRHLSSSPIFRAQAKSPSVKDKVEPSQKPSDKLRKKEGAIVREVARQIALAKANRKANRRRESALLNATPERQFCGDIIIESRSDAIDTAIEISDSNTNHQHLVFFVDGSRIPKSKEKSESSVPGGDLVAHLGAAVVYKFFESDQGWQERYITLPSGHCSTQAELAAIAEGLSDATKEMILLRVQDSKSPGRMDSDYKVTVFSDCTSALTQIDKLRTKSAATDPISCKLITRSQYLRRKGVQLELRWVPGHSKVKGIIRAHTAAQHAAMNQDIGVPLDEGLRLIEMEGGLSITNKQEQSKARLEGKLDDV